MSSSDQGGRIREMPAPRRSGGMIGPLFQRVFTWPYRFALAGLSRAGVRPWQLTFASLLANAVIGWVIVDGHLLVGGLLLIVAGLLDIFDGGVARLRGEAGPAGAFLDSTIDRISDVIVFGAIFWLEAGQGHRTAAALALSGLVVTLLISHLRAEGEALGLTLTEGFLQRLERYVALMIGLTAPGALVPTLALLTLLGAVTVAQRAWSAWGQLTSTAGKSDKALPPGLTEASGRG